MNINDAVIELQEVCEEFALVTEKRFQLYGRRAILLEILSQYLEEMTHDEY